MAKKEPESTVTFRLPADLHKRFKAVAAAERRSMNAAFVVLIEQHVADADRQPSNGHRAAA